MGFKRIVVLVASLVLAGRVLAAAAETCPPVPAMADVQEAAFKFPPRDRGLLWRLEKDGRVSWLYGTIHVGMLEWLVPGPTVMRALRGSDTIALELDLTKADELRASFAGLPGGSQAQLPAELSTRLDSEMKKACLPAAVGALRPALQALTLMSVAGRTQGLHPELGIDLIFTGMAAPLRKRIVALETAQDQMALFAPDTADAEREMVSEMLDELEKDRTRTMLRRLAAAWVRGDAEEFANYAQWCDCMKTDAEKAMMRRMNDDRNPAMADKLAQLHQSGVTFFAAVGTLHMTGEQSLVKLLAARGFDVQRVAFEPAGGGTKP